MRLFVHRPHPHKPVNVNEQHQSERTGLNDRLAVMITKGFGTMWALYILIIWMLGWMWLASIGFWLFAKDAWPFPFLLFCSNLVQLWALPAIMVGQNVINRHQQLLAEEQFNTTKKIFDDILQIMQHLDKQDEFMLRGETNDPQRPASPTT